jgi:hypothetical protein
MDSNILDELLNKIKSLEEKNVLLKSQIEDVKVQLKENKRDRLESMDGGENIEDRKNYFKIYKISIYLI